MPKSKTRKKKGKRVVVDSMTRFAARNMSISYKESWGDEEYRCRIGGAPMQKKHYKVVEHILNLPWRWDMEFMIEYEKEGEQLIIKERMKTDQAVNLDLLQAECLIAQDELDKAVEAGGIVTDRGWVCRII